MTVKLWNNEPQSHAINSLGFYKSQMELLECVSSKNEDHNIYNNKSSQ